MPSEWIDFRELRAKAKIEQVLRAYSIELKIKGDRATGFCPLPNHQGDRKSSSFSVHLTKGLFNCFSCKRGGNAIDLVAVLEQLDPQDPADIRKAALKLSAICGIATDTKRPAKEDPARSAVEQQHEPKVAVSKGSASTSDAETKVLINPPLDFELQKLDASHLYLTQRGFTPDTLRHFGLGYCSRGMLVGRIAIPLHDSDGQLIGYAGRLVNDAAIDAEHPKYLFPGERLKDGVKRTFAKSRFLYNGHQLAAPLARLVVVEGFTSVWWLHQHGISDVVALMGCDCSIEQAELIGKLVAADGVVYVLPDGDDAGARGAGQMLAQIGQHRAVRFHKLAQTLQPTDLSGSDLTNFLSH